MTYREWTDREGIEAEGKGGRDFVVGNFIMYLDSLKGGGFGIAFIRDQAESAFDVSGSRNLKLLSELARTGALWAKENIPPANHMTDD